jgi:hypothetical protein
MLTLLPAFLELDCSLSCLRVQDPTAGSYIEPCSIYLRFILILSPHLRLYLPNGSFPLDYPVKIVRVFSSLACVLHSQFCADTCHFLTIHSIQFANTLFPSVNVRAQVSRPYKNQEQLCFCIH